MVSRVARADLALDAPVKGGDRGWSGDRVAPAFPRRGSRAPGERKKKRPQRHNTEVTARAPLPPRWRSCRCARCARPARWCRGPRRRRSAAWLASDSASTEHARAHPTSAAGAESFVCSIDIPPRLIPPAWDEASGRNRRSSGRGPNNKNKRPIFRIFSNSLAVPDCLSLPRFASVDRQVHNDRYHLTRTRIPPLLSDVPPFENPACAPYNSTRELLLSTGSSSLAGAVALSLYPNNSEISNRGDTLGYARTRPLGPHSPIARARERRPATREVPRASETVGISSRAAPPPRPWKPSERFFRTHPRPRPSGRSPPPPSANRRRPLLIRA